jgi:hypothetical protein
LQPEEFYRRLPFCAKYSGWRSAGTFVKPMARARVRIATRSLNRHLTADDGTAEIIICNESSIGWRKVMSSELMTRPAARLVC